MHWEKKICIRITLKRIVGALLMASIVTNLVIVGAVFGADAAQAAPTPTSTMTSDPHIATFTVITSTAGETLTATQTLEPTPTDTPTATPTPTNTDQPTATLCIMRFDWPVYQVRRGDTLFSLAPATGSTVDELKAANCRVSDRIIAGELLYVPRLPVTPTPTPTFTETASPTATNTPPSPTIAPNSPPNVSILSPTDQSQRPYSGFDQNLNLWFTEVVLDGRASDLEDDVLSDSALVWSTNFGDPKVSSVLGSGIRVNAILYGDSCTGIWHTITLTAKDSQGATSTAVVNVFIGEGQLC